MKYLIFLLITGFASAYIPCDEAKFLNNLKAGDTITNCEFIYRADTKLTEVSCVKLSVYTNSCFYNALDASSIVELICKKRN